MANVAVYNMEGNEVGSIELSVREHRRLRRVLKFAAVEENHGDRKEPVMQDRVQSGLHSGRAAELYLPRHQGITHSSLIKKKRGLH